MLESNHKTLPFTEPDLDKGQFKTFRERLTFQPQTERGRETRMLGLDTETFTDASILCICDSDGRAIRSEDGPVSLEQLFLWLSSHNRRSYFTWNVSFDAIILLKSVPFEFLKSAYEANEERQIEFEFEGVKVKYLYRKALEFRRKNKVVRIYDAAQLYGKGSLEKTANKYLGRGKVEIGEKKFVRALVEPDTKKMDEIVQYCIEDARLTRDLAERWIATFYREFGYYPNRYYSAGSIVSEHVHLSVSRYPSFCSVPFAIQEAAYKSYYGGRFEIFERGTIEDVYHYDINSAYPAALADLPNQLPEFLEIETNVPRTVPIGPFAFRLGSKVIFPVGRFRTWTTEQEARLVPAGWYRVRQRFVPDIETEKGELADLIRKMYVLRRSKDTEDQKLVYKIMMNSIYGKTAQVRPKVGKLFSPILAAYITGYARGKLLAACGYPDEPKAPIALATDAVFSREPIPSLPISKEMGEWSFEHHNTFTVFMNGVYFVDGKPKTRGFSPTIEVNGKRVTISPEFVEASLTDEKASFTIKTDKPNPLISSLLNDWNPGEFMKREREIDLNADNKRIWPERLTNLKGSHISHPIVL